MKQAENGFVRQLARIFLLSRLGGPDPLHKHRRTGETSELLSVQPSPSPSPRPSPLGRGRTIRQVAANRGVQASPAAGHNLSLSPRERAGVRGNRAPAVRQVAANRGVQASPAAGHGLSLSPRERAGVRGKRTPAVATVSARSRPGRSPS
jgi:hypothetical protein